MAITVLPDARRGGLPDFRQSRRGQDDHMPSPQIFWHRELPPVNAQPMGAHVIDATSGRVPGTLEYRDAMWDRCYRELMAHVTERIGQEVVRLGGDCARVLAERIEQRRDERTGEAWMYGRFEYELYRR